MSAVAPRSPAPAKKQSEVDFRSGATLEQLSAQVSELVLLEQGEFGDQTALEVHTAKDFIFNMLGMSSANKNAVFAEHFHVFSPQTGINEIMDFYFDCIVCSSEPQLWQLWLKPLN